MTGLGRTAEALLAVARRGLAAANAAAFGASRGALLGLTLVALGASAPAAAQPSDGGWSVSAALRISCFRDCRGGAAADTRLCRACLISTCCGSDLLREGDESCAPYLDACPIADGGVVTAGDLAPTGCDVAFCEGRYRSFRVSDCTFQPLSGPRRACRSPAQEAAAAEAAAPDGCDVDFCEGRYRSFRAADCTFQPLSGPRRECRSPAQLAAAETEEAAALEDVDAPAGCDLAFCTNRYRSFRATDCTYQPFSGPRRLCVGPDGVQPGSPEAIAAAAAAAAREALDEESTDGDALAEDALDEDAVVAEAPEDGVSTGLDLGGLLDALGVDDLDPGAENGGDAQVPPSGDAGDRLALPDLTAVGGGGGSSGGFFDAPTVWVVGAAAGGAASLGFAAFVLLRRRRAAAGGVRAAAPEAGARPEPTLGADPVFGPEPAYTPGPPPGGPVDLAPAPPPDAPVAPGDALHIGPRPDPGRQRIVGAVGGPLMGAARPIGDLAIPKSEDPS